MPEASTRRSPIVGNRDGVGTGPSGDSHAFDAMGMFLARDGGVVDSICSSSACLCAWG